MDEGLAFASYTLLLNPAFRADASNVIVSIASARSCLLSVCVVKHPVSLARAATSIIFVTTILLLSRQTCVCCDKHNFVMTNVLP